jgi:hypothetical protein
MKAFFGKIVSINDILSTLRSLKNMKQKYKDNEYG